LIEITGQKIQRRAFCCQRAHPGQINDASIRGGQCNPAIIGDAAGSESPIRRNRAAVVIPGDQIMLSGGQYCSTDEVELGPICPAGAHALDVPTADIDVTAGGVEDLDKIIKHFIPRTGAPGAEFADDHVVLTRFPGRRGMDRFAQRDGQQAPPEEQRRDEAWKMKFGAHRSMSVMLDEDSNILMGMRSQRAHKGLTFLLHLFINSIGQMAAHFIKISFQFIKFHTSAQAISSRTVSARAQVLSPAAGVGTEMKRILSLPGLGWQANCRTPLPPTEPSSFQPV
jgi:hypothetical protein